MPDDFFANLYDVPVIVWCRGNIREMRVPLLRRVGTSAKVSHL